MTENGNPHSNLEIIFFLKIKSVIDRQYIHISIDNNITFTIDYYQLFSLGCQL